MTGTNVTLAHERPLSAISLSFDGLGLFLVAARDHRSVPGKPVSDRAQEWRLDPHTTKNDEGRTFPFTDVVQELLEAQKAEHDRLKAEDVLCPWVFHRTGKKVKGKRITRFTKAWRNACQKAGTPGRIPHDLRRTAVRNIVRAGIPERVAMQLTGHKTRSVFERYNIVSECDHPKEPE